MQSSVGAASVLRDFTEILGSQSQDNRRRVGPANSVNCEKECTGKEGRVPALEQPARPGDRPEELMPGDCPAED